MANIKFEGSTPMNTLTFLNPFISITPSKLFLISNIYHQLVIILMTTALTCIGVIYGLDGEGGEAGLCMALMKVKFKVPGQYFQYALISVL
jgi:hypothetical protein